MVRIKTFVFNSFQENTYVLSDKTGECIIIDAGCFDSSEKDLISRYIAEEQLKPKYLINTHGHIDHVLGNHFIKQKYGLDFLAHKGDLQMMQTLQVYASAFGIEVDEKVPDVDRFLEDGDIILFGETKAKILHVPGHSEGSIALYFEEDSLIFTGDVLFNASIGRTDLPGGSMDVLMQSIREKLLVLPDETEVFPGHGPKTSIKQEKEKNPFLV